MKKTFVIRSKDVILRLMVFLEAQQKEPLLEVVVKEHHQDRSVLQNSLYWAWNTVIAEELGLLKEEGYAAMIHAVRKVHTQGFKKNAKAMANQIVKLTSTIIANFPTIRKFISTPRADNFIGIFMIYFIHIFPKFI